MLLGDPQDGLAQWCGYGHGLMSTKPGPAPPGLLAARRKHHLGGARGGYLFHEGADFQALDLPYQGGQLSLLIVLPRKPDGLPALERKWADGHAYPQVTASLVHEESVIVALPRFKLETESQLGVVLCALGAGLAFQDDADFSGISAEPLKISEVVHKAFIEVNEEGTEAAAATGVVMAKCAGIEREPKRFIADHPFLFLIRDRKSNAVLFSGRILDPGP